MQHELTARRRYIRNRVKIEGDVATMFAQLTNDSIVNKFSSKMSQESFIIMTDGDNHLSDRATIFR